MTTTTTNTKRLVVVVGPTGSGKTDLAIALAQHYGAPIVSTDSRQFYRGMPIGTAQPTAQQLRAAEHHFIASHDITQELSCDAYEVEALALLDRLFEQHRTVIAVGGSGLYIKALCEGMDELPQADPELRAALAEQLREEGVAALAERLRTARQQKDSHDEQHRGDGDEHGFSLFIHGVLLSKIKIAFCRPTGERGIAFR